MGLFGNDPTPYTSPLLTAPYQPPQLSPFARQAPPAPLAIPPARPPVFYSGPDPASAAVPPSGGQSGAMPGLAGTIANGINDHALTLMALGAGIAQGGVGRGLELASSAAQAERNRALQQFSYLQTFKALTDGGVPPQEAQAAITNPSLMRALVTKYLGARAPGNAARGAASAGAATTNPGQGSASAAGSPAAIAQNSMPNAPLASASAPPVSVPALPPGVPNGSSYSRSRGMWRDGDGNLFDLQGRAVA